VIKMRVILCVCLVCVCVLLLCVRVVQLTSKINFVKTKQKFNPEQ